MLNTELITNHLMTDSKLAVILDLQAEGVAQSLCDLFNQIVGEKMKKGAGAEEEISDMELDANHDHAQAEAQLDGKAPLQPRRRKVIKKPPTSADKVMEESAKNEQGKRDATAAGAETPPAPKCQHLPAVTEETEAAKALAANAQAEANAAKEKEGKKA